MLNNTNMFTTEILNAMRGAVGRIIGFNHPDGVDDCVSKAVVACLEAIESFDMSRSFKPWACTVAANTARNYAKASCNHGHDSAVASDDDSDESSLVETLEGDDGRHTALRVERQQFISLAMATLKPDERAFIEALADGATQVEAAEVVGWTTKKASRVRQRIAADVAAYLETI